MGLRIKQLVHGNETVLLASRLRSSPAAFRLIAPFRQTHKNRMVTRQTDIVIEGLPRCANHFATFAFEGAQPAPIKIAHHFHAPAQILLGISWNIPCILLIREPIQQILSHLVYHRWLTPDIAIELYIRFMRTIAPYVGAIVVADFRDIINDMGHVIHRVNAHYGTTFTPFEHTPNNVRRVFERIDCEFMTHMSAGVTRNPAPSAEKERLKEIRGVELREPRHDAALRRATSLYERILNPIERHEIGPNDTVSYQGSLSVRQERRGDLHSTAPFAD